MFVRSGVCVYACGYVCASVCACMCEQDYGGCPCGIVTYSLVCNTIVRLYAYIYIYIYIYIVLD